MKQIEKINIELQLIQNGMRIISNLTNDFHESQSKSEIVEKLQNDTMNLFNEFTVKIQDLREEIYDNLNGLDVVLDAILAKTKKADTQFSMLLIS